MSSVNMIVEKEEDWPVMPVQKHGRSDGAEEDVQAAQKIKVDRVGDETMVDANLVSLPTAQPVVGCSFGTGSCSDCGEGEEEPKEAQRFGATNRSGNQPILCRG